MQIPLHQVYKGVLRSDGRTYAVKVRMYSAVYIEGSCTPTQYSRSITYSKTHPFNFCLGTAPGHSGDSSRGHVHHQTPGRLCQEEVHHCVHHRYYKWCEDVGRGFENSNITTNVSHHHHYQHHHQQQIQAAIWPGGYCRRVRVPAFRRVELHPGSTKCTAVQGSINSSLQMRVHTLFAKHAIYASSLLSSYLNIDGILLIRQGILREHQR